MQDDKLAVTYPGISQPLRAVVSMGHGVYPGRAIVEFVPQDWPPDRDGELVLQDGGRFIRFPNMRLESASLGQDAAGYFTRAVFYDARWKWRYGAVSAVCNYAGANGSITADTVITVADMMERCFNAMGVPSAFVDGSILPLERPYAYWAVKPAAAALSELLQLYGCDVVWIRNGNGYRIVRRGIGVPFPEDDDSTQELPSFDAAELPSSVTVVPGPDLYQTKLLLQAVSWDTDGQLKPLADLSYYPVDGWNTSRDPFGMSDVAGSEERELARAYAFRLYRVAGQAHGGFGSWALPFNRLDIAGPTRLEDLLPLQGELLREQTDSVGTIRTSPFVEGEFVPPKQMNGGTNSPPGYPAGAFTLRHSQGLVMFPRPMVKVNDGQTGFEAADLALTAAYRVQSARLPFATTRFVSVDPTAGTASHVEFHPEIQRSFIAAYGTGAGFKTYSGEVSNWNTSETLMTATLEAMKLQFENVQGQQVRYRRLVDLELDGARRQIVWTVDVNQGADTVCYANTEGAVSLAGLQMRRRISAAANGDPVMQALLQRGIIG